MVTSARPPSHRKIVFVVLLTCILFSVAPPSATTLFLGVPSTTVTAPNPVQSLVWASAAASDEAEARTKSASKMKFRSRRANPSDADSDFIVGSDSNSLENSSSDSTEPTPHPSEEPSSETESTKSSASSSRSSTSEKTALKRSTTTTEEPESLEEPSSSTADPASFDDSSSTRTRTSSKKPKTVKKSTSTTSEAPDNSDDDSATSSTRSSSSSSAKPKKKANRKLTSTTSSSENPVEEPVPSSEELSTSSSEESKEIISSSKTPSSTSKKLFNEKPTPSSSTQEPLESSQSPSSSPRSSGISLTPEPTMTSFPTEEPSTSTPPTKAEDSHSTTSSSSSRAPPPSTSPSPRKKKSSSPRRTSTPRHRRSVPNAPRKTLFTHNVSTFVLPDNMNYDEFGEDMYTHERIPHPEICREDLHHTPLVSPLGYQSNVGLAVSSYTTSGVHLSPDERGALGMHEVDLKIFNHTRLKARELFEELIRGDSVREPFGLSQVTDLYYKQQMESSGIHQHFCDRFVALLHARGYPFLLVHLFVSQVANFTYHCLFARQNELTDLSRQFVLLTSEEEGSALSSFNHFQQVDGDTVDNQVLALHLLNHPALMHWYSINGNIRHPNFTPIPKGFLFYHRSGRHFMPFDAARRYKEEYRNRVMTKMMLRSLNLTVMFPKVPRGPKPIRFAHYAPLFLEHALDVFTGGMLFAPGEWIAPNRVVEPITTVYIVLTNVNQPLLDGTRRMLLGGDVMIMRGGKSSYTKEMVEHIALIPFQTALMNKLQQHPHGDPERALKVLMADDRMPTTDQGSLCPHLKAHPELSHVVDEMGTEEWYTALNQFTFVACPLGLSYDSSCIWEALVFGAIPIVEIPDFEERLKLQMIQRGGTSIPNANTGEGQQMRRLGNVADLRDQPNVVVNLGDITDLQVASFLDVFEHLPVVFVKKSEVVTAENLKKWANTIFNQKKYKLEKLLLHKWMSNLTPYNKEK